jgi:carbon-monoxide dehydrogenase small subunit
MESQSVRISLRVNGQGVTADVEPRLLLVHFLREERRLTGTHIGCDTSQCGACTVLVDGRAVKSCTMLAVQADGREVTTIEGISPPEGLDPLQETFRAHHALQCGFCTPGMILVTQDLLRRTPDLDEESLREALRGNRCRCTGYHDIVRAVLAAARAGAPGPRTP